MQLVACSACHTQFDVTEHHGAELRCTCGVTVTLTRHAAVDALVTRCSACGAPVESNATQCGYCTAEIIYDRGKRTLLCPECYARNPQAAGFCSCCGVKFDPQQPAALDTDNCPACAHAMTARAIGGITVQECPKCLGLWVQEFEELVDRATQAARQKAPTLKVEPSKSKKAAFDSRIVYRQCPSCGTQMLRQNFGKRSGIIVDRCREHGTWLDADELEDIAAFILSGRFEAATSTAAANPLANASAASLEALMQTAKEERQRTRETWQVPVERHSPLGTLVSIGKFLSDLLN